MDISTLRAQTGYISLDDGYGNTGSCQSKVTFIDGEKGILRYRGIPIEELAQKSTFIETAYLLIYGHLPRTSAIAPVLRSWYTTENQFLHEDMAFHFQGFPSAAHPMAILSAMINAVELLRRRGLMHLAVWQAHGIRCLCRAIDFAGAHALGIRAPQIARPAVHLSQGGIQIHGEFSAHALSPCRTRSSILSPRWCMRWT